MWTNSSSTFARQWIIICIELLYFIDIIVIEYYYIIPIQNLFHVSTYYPFDYLNTSSIFQGECIGRFYLRMSDYGKITQIYRKYIRKLKRYLFLFSISKLQQVFLPIRVVYGPNSILEHFIQYVQHLTYQVLGLNVFYDRCHYHLMMGSLY